MVAWLVLLLGSLLSLGNAFHVPVRQYSSSTTTTHPTNNRYHASAQRQQQSKTAPFPTTTRLPPWSLSATQLGASVSSSSFDEVCEVLVLGSGPAACSIASLLATKLNVVLADQTFDREWVPNYGVWKDEWQAVCQKYQTQFAITLDGGKEGSAIDREWPITDCFFGGSFDIPVDQRMRLDRPYCRVDKNALKESLTTDSYRILKANHISEAIGINLYQPAGTMVHDAEGTTVQLQTSDGTIKTVRTKLVIDCTGHESSLVLKDPRGAQHAPGFQIAYGCMVDVEELTPGAITDTQIGPYNKNAMTLFDYRTDHYDDASEAQQTKLHDAPTFMYAMPIKDNQIFFEETSLVARPAISFQECKDRCYKRLAFHGLKVTKEYEEEFCYIPMGGSLPQRDQRIIALGGSAAMVHPSTGYHICRCLMGAADMANVILSELAAKEDKDVNLDRVAANAYHALWSPENIRQRNFAVFGGEFLMKQNVVGLRGFFDGFFRLPLAQWGGFLAGWPGLPNNDQHESWWARMLYGLNFIIKIPPPVALDMALSIIQYSFQEITLLQSVTPFLGEPESYQYQRNQDRLGDVSAKMEAREMIASSKVTQDMPVAFDEETAKATIDINNVESSFQ